jgi:RimJ/RimL family protein N-acetyltransferase
MKLCSIFSAWAKGKKAKAPKAMTIETPRLILREHRKEDIDAIYQISKTKDFKYFCFDGTRQKAVDFIDEALRTQKIDPKTGLRPNHMLAIVTKDTGEVIGHTCMEAVDYLKGADFEVNFFVDPKYQNKGYGLEAILNLTDYGFQKYNLPTLTVTVHPNNGPSRHLIVKEGYQKVDDIIMDTVDGPEPRELFVLQRDTFYNQRKLDKRPILLSQVGNLPANNNSSKGMQP